jgi:hypothetical protein
MVCVGKYAILPRSVSLICNSFAYRTPNLILHSSIKKRRAGKHAWATCVVSRSNGALYSLVSAPVHTWDREATSEGVSSTCAIVMTSACNSCGQ